MFQGLQYRWIYRVTHGDVGNCVWEYYLTFRWYCYSYFLILVSWVLFFFFFFNLTFFYVIGILVLIPLPIPVFFASFSRIAYCKVCISEVLVLLIGVKLQQSRPMDMRTMSKQLKLLLNLMGLHHL